MPLTFNANRLTYNGNYLVLDIPEPTPSFRTYIVPTEVRVVSSEAGRLAMTWIKDPEAVLDYALDFSMWLGAGDTLKNSVWSLPANPDNLAIALQTSTTTVAAVWLSGGLIDKIYKVTCRVTTVAGRVDDRTITIKVKGR